MNFILFFIFPMAFTQNATVPSVTNVTVPATQIGMRDISKHRKCPRKWEMLFINSTFIATVTVSIGQTNTTVPATASTTTEGNQNEDDTPAVTDDNSSAAILGHSLMSLFCLLIYS